jgi:hypothetical protein
MGNPSSREMRRYKDQQKRKPRTQDAREHRKLFSNNGAMTTASKKIMNQTKNATVTEALVARKCLK